MITRDGKLYLEVEIPLEHFDIVYDIRKDTDDDGDYLTASVDSLEFKNDVLSTAEIDIIDYNKNRVEEHIENNTDMEEIRENEYYTFLSMNNQRI